MEITRKGFVFFGGIGSIYATLSSSMIFSFFVIDNCKYMKIRRLHIINVG